MGVKTGLARESLNSKAYGCEPQPSSDARNSQSIDIVLNPRVKCTEHNVIRLSFCGCSHREQFV